MAECFMRSFLDQDLYKINMWQVDWSNWPTAEVEYTYINRDKTWVYPDNIIELLDEQLTLLEKVTLQDDEFEWINNNLTWTKITFRQWLRQFRFKKKYVNFWMDNGQLHGKIRGPIIEVKPFEVILLYMISEICGEHTKVNSKKYDRIYADAMIKGERLTDAGVKFVNFGSRRRFSYHVEDVVTKALCNFQPNFRGTSNMHFAKKYNLKPFGTCAHEHHMFCQAMFGVRMSNRMALETWVKEFKGELGIALPDTLTTKHFLKHDFDTYYSKLFDGMRQDSGDPIVIGESYVSHYKRLRIDPMTKLFVPSDSLNVDKSIMIQKHFDDRILQTHGMGTHFTNDLGVKAINQVIKMTKANCGYGWIDLVKLSDDEGKETGDHEQVSYVKREIGYNQ